MGVRYALLTAIVIVFVLKPAIVPASEPGRPGFGISSVQRLNLTRGKINGEKVDYILELPLEWSGGYLIAEREQIKYSGELIEKVIFSYAPQSNKLKPVFLMNFLVYDQRYHKNSDDDRALLETEEYVFSVSSAQTNPFTNETDKALFGRFMNEAENDDFITKFIQLPNGQKVIYNNTITVDNKKMAGKSEVKENGTVYAPLRETLESMGYRVGWLEKERAITIAKGDFYHLTLLNTQQPGKGYKTIIINDRAYVSSIFFVQILNASIEIDSNYNIFISSVRERS
jgi:hypothetical protein